jgi:hypothetical protein
VSVAAAYLLQKSNSSLQVVCALEQNNVKTTHFHWGDCVEVSTADTRKI